LRTIQKIKKDRFYFLSNKQTFIYGLVATCLETESVRGLVVSGASSVDYERSNA
jgi:hypothetical protein